MTPEELLKPRYKVIADYPDSIFKVGGILVEGEKDLTEAAKYPAIFKKLEWWEDRKESDMPQYVKWKHRNQVFPLKDLNSVNQPHLLSVTLPATKEEYEKQKQ